jgi:DNA-binding MarR family transcriptional regulator
MSSLEHDIEILENAVRLFAQTIKRPQRWATVTAQANVSIDRPSAVILQTLLLSEPSFCRVQDLAVRLGIEPPSVTRKTQELEQAGYLRRVPDPADRRAIDLRITPRGRTIANRLWKAQRAILANALRDWNPADRRQFVKLFERFSNDLLTASITQQRPAAKRGVHG